MAAAVRPYQVVVWGSTGFVGNLVCEQLLRDYQVLAANWSAQAHRQTLPIRSDRYDGLLANVFATDSTDAFCAQSTRFWRAGQNCLGGCRSQQSETGRIENKALRTICRCKGFHTTQGAVCLPSFFILTLVGWTLIDI